MANDLTYKDYIDRINIQDALLYAGYRLNRRDGLRYPSYVRVDDHGQRIRGDKFIVTNQGKSCFRPPEQKTYNIISLIKSFPGMFPENAKAGNPDRLVNEVCRRLLNLPQETRSQRIIEGHREVKPFDISGYRIQRFDRDNFESIKSFFPYFKSRGIDISTQRAFADHFVLASKQRQDGKHFANLSFPLVIPGSDGIVGLEERGRTRLDGSSGYKGKAEGSNGSEGLWVAGLGKRPLEEAGHVYWFESAYDAMAYYQLHAARDPGLRKAVFVSSGGNVTVGQMQRMLAVTPSATHHICFDNDLAGRQFAENLKGEIHRIALSSVTVTPERKSYLNSIPLSQDFSRGDVETLPKPLQDKYARYESAREEAMSMREGMLSHPDDIRDQENVAKSLFREYRESVRDFLGIDPQKDTSYVREIPQRGKDWNEQLLLERGEQEEDEGRHVGHETRRQYAGIDIDGNGEIESDEVDEIRENTLKARR